MKTGQAAHIVRSFTLALIALAIVAGSCFHVLDSYELPTLDLRFRLRPPIAATDKVAIIEIGDDTIGKIGLFPFDRTYHALLTKALSEAGAKAVIFDLFFSEPQKGDAEFEAAVRKAGNVYLPLVFELDGMKTAALPLAGGEAARNLEGLSSSARGLGHINVIPDIDGKYRRAPAYIRYGGSVYPYLPLKVACDYLGISQGDVKIVPGKYVDLGRGIRIPLDEHSLMLVNFSGSWGKTYKHYSFVDILQSYLAKTSGEEPNMDLAGLKDKVCIVGLTAVGTVDLHPNPFDALYPAVGMHAETFSSVIMKSFVRRASRETNAAVLIFLCALISILALKTKPLRGLFALSSAIIIYALVSMLVFTLYGVWLDVIYPVVVIVALHLALTLYKYAREWKARILMENELGIAKKIQESFLPKGVPAVEGVDSAVSMFTARQVGGDLYDFVSLGARRFGVMIGDVSGKGVPAALFMAMAVGAFRSFAAADAKPETVLADLNAKLVRESSSNLFVTVYYMIFDMERRAISYANGGHLPALYLPAKGAPQFLDSKDGVPLGLMDGPYSGGRITFGAGDTFVFYTDGITEAMNGRGDMYGKERLQAVVDKNRSCDPRQLLAAIEGDVRKFEPKSRQHDDMTAIVLKMT